jgi:hypothetical protein
MIDWTPLLELVRTRWRRGTGASAAAPPIPPIERPQPRVPAEYRPLHTYLDRRYAAKVVLTFEQMEALMGRALPPPAYTELDWWTGAAARTSRHSEAWVGAGRTAIPNFSAKIVTFERLP